MVKRPSLDANLWHLQLICGPSLDEASLKRLIHALLGVLSLRDRMPPVGKASACASLLILASAVPNLHQNVLVDYLSAAGEDVYASLLDVFRESALSRTVAVDALLLLVLMCAYQRFERRSATLCLVRDAAVLAVHGSVLVESDAMSETAPEFSGGDVSPPRASLADADEVLTATPAAAARAAETSFTGIKGMCTPAASTVITSSSMNYAASYLHSVVRSLTTACGACTANMCAVSQAPLLSKLDGRTVDESASHVITPASLAAGHGQSGGLFAYMSSAMSSLASLSLSVVGSLTGSTAAPSVAKDIDPVLLACLNRIGAHCPPAESLRSPVRLPFATRTAVLLLAFHDLCASSFEALWLCSGATNWRSKLTV